MNENKVSAIIGFPEGQCKKCLKTIKKQNKYMFEVNSEKIEYDSQKITIKDILKYLIKRNGYETCCLEFMQMKNSCENLVVLKFSQPTDINISSFEKVWGIRLKYMSHLKQLDQDSRCSFFRKEDNILYQNSDGNIYESRFGIQTNVSILAVLLTGDHKRETETKYYKYCHKKYLSILSPEKDKKKARAI